MIIGLTTEQRERLEAAAQAYFNEITAIMEEVVKNCKTTEDMEMAVAVIKVAIEQAHKKAEENSTQK